MIKLILPVGISGCGKSTYRDKLLFRVPDMEIIEPDKIRKNLAGDVNDQSMNMEVFRKAWSKAAVSIRNGKKVFFDATNLLPEYIMPELQMMGLDNDEVAIVILDCNPNVSKKRIAKDLEAGKDRSATPDEIIDLQYEQYKDAVKYYRNNFKKVYKA